MAYAINTGALVEVSLRGAVDFQRTLTLLHYRFTSGAVIADGKAFLSDLVTELMVTQGLGAAFKACLSDQTSVLEVRAQWIYPQRYVYEAFLVGTGQGTEAQNPLPSNVAVAILKRSELAGRKNRGTTHMWGVPTSFVSASAVTAAGLTAYTALGNKLKLTLSMPGPRTLVPVIYHRAAPAESPTISSVIPEGTSRTMRRRTLGVGE